jgi:hypothetical protein
MTAYDIGDAVTMRAAFATEAGVPTNPTDVTLRTLSPAGVEATYALGSLTALGAGVYTKTISVAESGRWFYRWLGTGAVQAAEEGDFWVRESRFAWAAEYLAGNIPARGRTESPDGSRKKFD